MDPNPRRREMIFPQDLGNDWQDLLDPFTRTDTWQTLSQFVGQQRELHTVFPPEQDVFTAFRLTPFAEVKVVILGQDPYHGEGQAHGLSFSVRPGIKIPPSLRNIYKELAADLGTEQPASGDLTHWARQGVFLLNTVLTVIEAEAHSHRKQGWEAFTDFVIRQFDDHPHTVVFVLWGKPAEKKANLIGGQHKTIISPHPSPLSAHRGFFGSKPFSLANNHLKACGRPLIDWQIP